MHSKEVQKPAMKQVAQGQATAVDATADPFVNLEKIASDNGGFVVVERVNEPSNNTIALHDEDLKNICSWLGQYDAKTLWIESGHDSFAESMHQNDIPLLGGAKDKSHINNNKTKDNRTYSKNDALVQIKPENSHQEAHLVVKKVETDKLETVEDNGSEANGDIQALGVERVDDTESLSDEQEGEVDNIVEKWREKQQQEDDLKVVEGDDEEEYYLIEEIIEEGEEENVGIGESDCEPTREDMNEDEEHHQVVKKQCKRKELEVFVGGLHRHATREDIYEVFSQVGDVKSIRMARDRWSNKNRGYAFVQYGTVEQARRALKELKYPVVHGKSCDVTASRENDTLFVGNICKTWSQEHFKEKLKSYGVVNYKEVVMIQDKRYQGANKGFAFLEFWSLAQATWAYVRLHKSHVVFGMDRAAKVSFAVFDKSDREITFQAKTVFINGVPPTWDEDMIRSCLQKYGFIESVKLARDMNAAKRLDFGYVTFDTDNSAHRCIQGINAYGLGKGLHKVKVEAQFCRARKPRSMWHVKGNRDMCSREKSTRDLHFSPLLPEEDHTHGRMPKRVAEISISVLPARDSQLKRSLRLTDRDQVFSVSKRPRRMVSFLRSPKRMLQDQECCVKRSTKEHLGADYDSHHVIVEQSSSCRNKYSCTSCGHVYSDRHSHSYDQHSQFYDKYFRGGSLNLPQHSIESCYCEFPKRMDCNPDMYKDLNIRQMNLRCDYDAISSSRCAPCAKSSSQNRHELSNVAYGSGSGISFRDRAYRGSNDWSYSREFDGIGELRGASSSSDRKYYYQRSDGDGNSYLSFHEHSCCCDSTSQGCRNSFKRESY